MLLLMGCLKTSKKDGTGIPLLGRPRICCLMLYCLAIFCLLSLTISFYERTKLFMEGEIE